MKKYLAGLLAIVLAASLLTACGSKETPAPQTAPEPAPEPAIEEPEPAEEEFSVEEEEDEDDVFVEEELPQDEICDPDFDAEIPAIVSASFEIGGYFGGYETRTVDLTEDTLHYTVEEDFSEDAPNEMDCAYTKEAFLDSLRALHLSEWKTSYFNPNIVDGTQWHLTIAFSDGHKTFDVGGSNAFPDNFNELQALFGFDPIDLTAYCP